jgi:hypothetical protein
MPEPPRLDINRSINQLRNRGNGWNFLADDLGKLQDAVRVLQVNDPPAPKDNGPFVPRNPGGLYVPGFLPILWPSDGLKAPVSYQQYVQIITAMIYQAPGVPNDLASATSEAAYQQYVAQFNQFLSEGNYNNIPPPKQFKIPILNSNQMRPPNMKQNLWPYEGLTSPVSYQQYVQIISSMIYQAPGVPNDLASATTLAAYQQYVSLFNYFLAQKMASTPTTPTSGIFTGSQASAQATAISTILGTKPVTTVFGRTGVVVPSPGDYSVGMVTGASPKEYTSALAGMPAAGQLVLIYTATVGATFPANFSGSVGSDGTNPTATATYTVALNGTTIGTIVISTGGAFAFSTTGGSPQAMGIGNRLTIAAPAPQDVALSDVSISLLAM